MQGIAEGAYLALCWQIELPLNLLNAPFYVILDIDEMDITERWHDSWPFGHMFFYT